MLVYVARVLHVTFGVLQGESSPIYVGVRHLVSPRCSACISRPDEGSARWTKNAMIIVAADVRRLILNHASRITRLGKSEPRYPVSY
jgi:hypothetical protein